MSPHCDSTSRTRLLQKLTTFFHVLFPAHCKALQTTTHVCASASASAGKVSLRTSSSHRTVHIDRPAELTVLEVSRILDLAHNLLSCLSEDIFSPLASLTHLYIDGNSDLECGGQISNWGALGSPTSWDGGGCASNKMCTNTRFFDSRPLHVSCQIVTSRVICFPLSLSPTPSL